MERNGSAVFVDENQYSVAWPVTYGSEWCGEHPAMSRWIAEKAGPDAD
jgi:hypothetical protein